MKKSEWPTPFRDVRSLVCEKMYSSEGEDLFLHLVEHHSLAHEVSLSIGSATLDGLRPIQRTAESREWIVHRQYVVAFKSSSESFYLLHAFDEPYPGHSFFIAESPWLADFYQNTHLEAIHPSCRHFAIYTDHKIIEVLSPHEPEIEFKELLPPRTH
jgi:hypothetical protein